MYGACLCLCPSCEFEDSHCNGQKPLQVYVCYRQADSSVSSVGVCPGPPVSSRRSLSNSVRTRGFQILCLVFSATLREYPAAIAASLSLRPLSFPNKKSRCMSVRPFFSSDLRRSSCSLGVSAGHCPAARGLGWEHCIASPQSVPKFGAGFWNAIAGCLSWLALLSNLRIVRVRFPERGIDYNVGLLVPDRRYVYRLALAVHPFERLG